MDIVTRKNEENRKLSESHLNDIVNKLSELQKFYDGKNVFVTGGTGRTMISVKKELIINRISSLGFMGKMLIDKLLRTCPGIENIYLLVRPKKGKDIHTRLDEIFDDLVIK